jgi:hypothetical protein
MHSNALVYLLTLVVINVDNDVNILCFTELQYLE